MSQMESDGVEDVINGQGRLVAGAAGTAMAAAARMIAERTRRQREVAAAQLASDRARAEADRRLLLVRLEMSTTDRWREQATLDQVGETLYLARLHERTEPSATAAIPDLEEHIRSRFDREPAEVLDERIRDVADQREAETVYALDALERADGAMSGPSAAGRDATPTGEQRGAGTPLLTAGTPSAGGAPDAPASTTSTPAQAARGAAPGSAPQVAPRTATAAAATVAGTAATAARSAARGARRRTAVATTGARAVTSDPTGTATRSRGAAPVSDVGEGPAPAVPRQALMSQGAPGTASGAPARESAMDDELAHQMLAQHRAALARSQGQDHEGQEHLP